MFVFFRARISRKPRCLTGDIESCVIGNISSRSVHRCAFFECTWALPSIKSNSKKKSPLRHLRRSPRWLYFLFWSFAARLHPSLVRPHGVRLCTDFCMHSCPYWATVSWRYQFKLWSFFLFFSKLYACSHIVRWPPVFFCLFFLPCFQSACWIYNSCGTIRQLRHIYEVIILAPFWVFYICNGLYMKQRGW